MLILLSPTTIDCDNNKVPPKIKSTNVSLSATN